MMSENSMRMRATALLNYIEVLNKPDTEPVSESLTPLQKSTLEFLCHHGPYYLGHLKQDYHYEVMKALIQTDSKKAFEVRSVLMDSGDLSALPTPEGLTELGQKKPSLMDLACQLKHFKWATVFASIGGVGSLSQHAYENALDLNGLSRQEAEDRDAFIAIVEKSSDVIRLRAKPSKPALSKFRERRLEEGTLPQKNSPNRVAKH